jgi:aminomethyltransferase
MRETTLRPVHAALGARLVEFAGWHMPVQYTGILDEVRTVRSQAGLFDLGHMGRVRLQGRDAEAFLQRLQTNDAREIKPGRIRYALILDEQGRTQDDILVYRNPRDDGFFLVINAGNTARDLGIMRRLAAGFGDLRIDDATDRLGMVAIQGPASQAIVQELCRDDLSALRYYAWIDTRIGTIDLQLSRTGYTGEDGFEFYVDAAATRGLWDLLMQTGAGHGLRPIGLGARDTLRLEAGMPLYGHEIDEETNPLEANLDWAVKFTHDFVGRAALEKVRAQGGSGRRLVGLTSGGKRVPRQGHPVRAGGQDVGSIRSGAVSPTLATNIATAYVRETFAAPGTAVEFAVKDRTEPAVVVPLPFYQRKR